jgi:hypothetical protein
VVNQYDLEGDVTGAGVLAPVLADGGDEERVDDGFEGGKGEMDDLGDDLGGEQGSGFIAVVVDCGPQRHGYESVRISQLKKNEKRRYELMKVALDMIMMMESAEKNTERDGGETSSIKI